MANAENSKLQLNNMQKAAAVIVSLGAEKAAQIYQHMDAEDVEQLTLEVVRLGMIDSEQTEEILSEFYQHCITNKAVTEGGLEYARAVLVSTYGTYMASGMMDKLVKSLNSNRFSFLNKTDAKTLYAVLQHERPQTIALVLSYIDPDKVAAVIEQIEPEKQVRVIEAIANMESASPTAVKIIESEMERKFARVSSGSNIKVGGINYVADIMNNLDRSSEKSIFDSLAVRSEDLVTEIRKRMFTFEDIVSMDDRSVRRFIQDCDPKDIVLALKQASGKVANKLFSNMSTRMAENIREDLEITSNVRMKDVEEAQQRITSIIRDLEERNEIIILRGGKDDIIA